MPNSVNQLAKILPTAWDDHASVHYSKLTDATNTLLGYNGAIPMVNTLDLNNNPIQNVAAPKVATDALNLGTADEKYSATAIGPQLDVGGKHALKGLTNLYLQSQKGLTVTETTAKLTPGGTNGSKTYTKGLLTAFTPAT